MVNPQMLGEQHLVNSELSLSTVFHSKSNETTLFNLMTLSFVYGISVLTFTLIARKSLLTNYSGKLICIYLQFSNVILLVIHIDYNRFAAFNPTTSFVSESLYFQLMNQMENVRKPSWHFQNYLNHFQFTNSRIEYLLLLCNTSSIVLLKMNKSAIKKL